MTGFTVDPSMLRPLLVAMHSGHRPEMPRFVWFDRTDYSDLDWDDEMPEPCPRLAWAHRPFTHTIGPVESPRPVLPPERLERYRHAIRSPENP